jgi:nucleolar protein 58
MSDDESDEDEEIEEIEERLHGNGATGGGSSSDDSGKEGKKHKSKKDKNKSGLEKMAEKAGLNIKRYQRKLERGEIKFDVRGTLPPLARRMLRELKKEAKKATKAEPRRPRKQGRNGRGLMTMANKLSGQRRKEEKQGIKNIHEMSARSLYDTNCYVFFSCSIPWHIYMARTAGSFFRRKGAYWVRT